MDIDKELISLAADAAVKDPISSPRILPTTEELKAFPTTDPGEDQNYGG